MKAENCASRSVVGIADLLLRQVKAMGIFALPLGLPKGPRSEGLDQRLGFIHSLFQVLESASGLRLEYSDGPILYNTADWPPGTSIGGYPGVDCGPKPSQLVISYLGSWNLHAEQPDNPSAVGLRVLRSALWVVRKRGLPPAVDYVFDLLRNGFVVNLNAATVALTVLRDACRKTADDSSIADCFFNGRAPVDPDHWARPELTIPDFETLPDVRTSVAFDEALLRAATIEIDRVRKSPDYDTWLLGQWGLLAHLGPVFQILRSDDSKVGPALTSALDTFEEMYADSGAFSLATKAGYGGHPLRPEMINTGLMIRIFRAQRPHDWQRRILQDRLLVPDKLKGALSDWDGTPRPEGWKIVSPELAPIFAQVALDCEFCEGWSLSEANSHGLEELMKTLEMAMKLRDSGRHRERISMIKGLIETHPWLGFTHYELGIAYDDLALYDDALASIQTSIAINPRRPERWISLGVVLGHVGCGEEAFLAHAIGEMLEQSG